MRKFVFMIFAGIHACSCFAQEDEASVDAVVLRGSVLIPISINAEYRLSNNVTFNSFLGVGPEIIDHRSIETKFTVTPFFETGIRRYLNLNRRMEKGKVITGNSGNYLTSSFNYSFLPLTKDAKHYFSNEFVFALRYGMQRSYGRFFWNSELGFHFMGNNSYYERIYGVSITAIFGLNIVKRRG